MIKYPIGTKLRYYWWSPSVYLVVAFHKGRKAWLWSSGEPARVDANFSENLDKRKWALTIPVSEILRVYELG